MTGFLASVANMDEARIARGLGADFIDAEDPTAGALAPETIRQIVEGIARETPVSASVYDRSTDPEITVAAVRALAATGVDYIKVGLFPEAGREACIRALAAVARQVKLIGVMFADHGADLALTPLMQQAGFAGAMIDTAHKHETRLLDLYAPTALMRVIEAFHAHGLLAGLAGSLELPDIPRLLPLAPDFLAFRRALCGENGRGGAIDADAVRRIRASIPRGEGSASAAEGVSAKPRSASDSRSGADRMFVHDFVLPVSIGVYSREREQPQRVRFNVDIDIRRLDRSPSEIRDVLSYDVVTDGIAIVVAKGHIALVEELAEQVATLVLAHRRVTRVTVRVEKLDVGPGSVGVEIIRERVAEANPDPQFPAPLA